MATYAPIPTGYVDDGPLGALWAGQNANAQRQQNEMSNLADMMDIAAKGQTYDHNTLMNPERLTQLQGTNLGQRLTNEFDSYSLGNRKLASDEAGRMSQTRLNTPGWFDQSVAGDMATAQGKVTDQKFKADTLGARTAVENTKGQSAQVDYANSLLPSMRGMNELQMANYMQSRGVSADVARAYLEIARGRGGVDKLIDSLSRTEKSAAAERLQKQQDDAAMNRTLVQARASVESARLQAKSAEAAGDKVALAAVLGSAKSTLDQLKVQIAAVDEDISGLSKEGKESESYKKKVAYRDRLYDEMIKSDKLVKQVTLGIIGDPEKGNHLPAAAPHAGAVLPPVAAQAPAAAVPGTTGQVPRASRSGQIYGSMTPVSLIEADAAAGDPYAIEWLRAKAQKLNDANDAYTRNRGRSAPTTSGLDATTEDLVRKYAPK